MAEEYLTDDEQLEFVKRWSAENGTWIVGGIVVAVALVFGWRYYDGYRNERAFKAAAQFGAMTAALDKNDRNAARQIAEGIIKDYASTPYGDQAELILARLFVDDNQLANAVTPLLHVMKDSKDSELKNIARLRLARVLIDEGKPDDAIQTLAEAPAAPVAGAAAFASRYHEVHGDALYAKKDLKGALAEYQAALRSGDGRSSDASLLQLKITDLGAAPAAATSKAKP
jgi:predicted negative regulator of RcsB-dependent stress response